MTVFRSRYGVKQRQRHPRLYPGAVARLLFGEILQKLKEKRAGDAEFAHCGGKADRPRPRSRPRRAERPDRRGFSVNTRFLRIDLRHLGEETAEFMTAPVRFGNMLQQAAVEFDRTSINARSSPKIMGLEDRGHPITT